MVRASSRWAGGVVFLAALAALLQTPSVSFLPACSARSASIGGRGQRTVSQRALGTDADLENMRKRELIELLSSRNVDAAGLTKPELIRRLRDMGSSDIDHQAATAPPSMSQREVAEIAMDEWQNATTVGFDCKAGRHAGDGVEFDIIGPSGHVDHKVRFSLSWPPVCSCPDAQSLGSQQRCKHVCMILVKCGVPYASVSDGGWKPSEMEVKSIVQHMKGKWSPIPLQDS